MRSFYCLYLIACLNIPVLAQFTPPGLGEVHTADWLAFGLKKEFERNDKFASTSYLGVGRTSTPEGYNPFQRGAIYVVNQELSFQNKKHWKYSVGISYRWQNRFKTVAPLERDSPSGRSEMRYFGKITYQFGESIFKYSLTYRPEFRTFYNPDFSPYESPFQFRSRIKATANVRLNKAKTQKAIVMVESLFAKNKNQNWERTRYNDTRICLYYSLSPKNTNFTFNLGYMNNLVGRHHPKAVHYFAFDVLWHIPSKALKT